MPSTPRRIPAHALALAAIAVVTAASCRSGCQREAGRAASVEGRLAMFPVSTRVVVSLDVGTLRAGPAAAKLTALAKPSDADDRALEQLVRRTGFDPLTQLASITLAFPEDASANGELGLIVRAERLDETRLVAYARDELQKNGDDLVPEPHGRFTLWSSRRDRRLAGFFVDAQTFALGAGGWAPRMAELAEAGRPGDSAATNVDLVHLVERAADKHAVWAAALVPEATRRKLGADPQSAAAAGVLTLSGGLDIGKGLEAVLIADLATPAEARGLAERATAALRDAKRNAQVLMLGLGPHLDGIVARANDKTFELRASLGEAALDDILARLKGLLALSRAGRVPGF